MAIGFAVVFFACQKDDVLLAPETDPQIAQDEDFSRFLGCELTPADEYAKIDLAKDLPEPTVKGRVVLSTPPIGNQGNEGSCVAWASAYAVRSILKHAQSGGSYSTSTNIFSPEYVYNQIKLGSCSAGSYPTTALNLIKSQGVSTWAVMPYSSTNGCSIQPNSTQKANAANYKISSYSRITISTSNLKAYINSGKAIMVAGPVDNAFMNLKNTVLKTCSGSGGGHAYAVVGYDDAYSAFIVQNSWGTSWGVSGFGYISTSIITRLWTEAYIMN